MKKILNELNDAQTMKVLTRYGIMQAVEAYDETVDKAKNIFDILDAHAEIIYRISIAMENANEKMKAALKKYDTKIGKLSPHYSIIKALQEDFQTIQKILDHANFITGFNAGSFKEAVTLSLMKYEDGDDDVYGAVFTLPESGTPDKALRTYYYLNDEGLRFIKHLNEIGKQTPAPLIYTEIALNAKAGKRY